MCSRVDTKKMLAMMHVEELLKELARLLEMKSCLIVLDDLLDTMEWDLIMPRLIPQMEKTSRIIVTTRKQNIAEHCSREYGRTVYNLKVLGNDDALKLFSNKVFGEATYLVENSPELVGDANHILKKCGGLPLSIVTIGGFLANRPKIPVEWRKLNDNISAELEINPDLGMIRTVLEKSYDGLPFHLKACFLYLSIFPEDQMICRRRLVRRWAVEGYSSDTCGKSAVEMADSYFVELQNRSMVLPYQQSAHSRKSIDSCKVHDLMREIAISKAIEENVVFRLEEGCSLNTHGTVRHLAISSSWKGDKTEFESMVSLSRVRSLSVFGDWKPFYISKKMKLLRVLDLEGTKGVLYGHLRNIGKLHHLKYLSLRGCFDLFLLPDSIGNLRHLQTLDIRNTLIVTLPKTIINLRELKYVHCGCKLEYMPEDEISSLTRCLFGLQIPPRVCAVFCIPRLANIEGISRRDICTYACCVEMPAAMTGFEQTTGATVPIGLRLLKQLQILRVVCVARAAVLQDIKMLTGLRKLGVTHIKKKHGQAFCQAISNLRRLESLSVISEGKPGLCGCLDHLTSPPENLQSLKLYGNLEVLPEWTKRLQQLVKLKLVGTNLSDHDAAMELIGNLPKLEVLGLFVRSFRGNQLHFRSVQTQTAFRSLRVMKLAGIMNIKMVKFVEGSMPKLELLQVMVSNGTDFAGLELLASINEMQLSLLFSINVERVNKAEDNETRENILEEEEHEARRKGAELKNKLRGQLAKNPNHPILTVN